MCALVTGVQTCALPIYQSRSGGKFMSTTTQATDTVLSVSNLTVCFAGAPANVVDGVSFSVQRGKTLAIVGESGCGKSVTSMALMGLLPDTAKIAARTSALLDEALLGMPDERLLDVRGNRSEEHTVCTPVPNAHLVCRLLLEK